MATHSSTLAWKIPWMGSLVGCTPWGCKELDTTERLHFHFSLPCIEEGNGNPFQCFCLENPRDRGTWWAAISGAAQSQTRLKQLSSSSSRNANQKKLVGILCVCAYLHFKYACIFSESCSFVSDSLQPHGLCSSWNSPGQNIGVGSLSILQGILSTQGSNPDLPLCRQILYQLSHKRSPRILEWVAYPFSSRSSGPTHWTGVYCIIGGFFTNWAMREAQYSEILVLFILLKTIYLFIWLCWIFTVAGRI